MQLNDSQREAVTADAPRIAVIAGPGSGKTRVLVERLARKENPSSVAVITFTNAAANEIKRRSGVRPGYCGTLHGLAYRVVCQNFRELGFQSIPAIVTDEEFLDEAVALSGQNVPPALVTDLLNRCEPMPGMFSRTPAHRALLSVLNEMRANNVVTLSALLWFHIQAIEAGWCNLFTEILVDEAQDSAPADWRIYNAYQCMAVGSKLFAVGDPQQSIYGFRGADVASFAGFASTARVVNLAVNYRSDLRIVEYANRLSQYCEFKRPSPLVAASCEFGVVTEESHGVQDTIAGRAAEWAMDACAKGTTSVVTPTNHGVEVLRAALMAAGVPVVFKEQKAADSCSRARAALSYILNPGSRWLALAATGNVSFMQAIRSGAKAEPPMSAEDIAHAREDMAWGMGRLGVPHHEVEAVLKIREASPDLDIAGILVALSEKSGGKSGVDEEALLEAKVKPVVVQTVHAAKGREYDAVAFVDFKPLSAMLVGERLRVLFVAATRPRHTLAIITKV